MNHRRLGNTDLAASDLGFGCARIGGVFHGSAKAELVHLLRTAVDRGINFFDTADLYAQGESEALVGEALRGRRQQVIIATKVGYCLPAQRKVAARIKPLLRPVVQKLGLRRQQLPGGLRGGLGQDFSPDHIVKAAEQSLRRLRTDVIDLYQLHSPPTALLETGDVLAPLELLKQQGKIRYYGVSCELVADALLCLRYSGVSALQEPINLLFPEALDEALPRAQAQGVGIIARQCFASGLLARPHSPLVASEPRPSDEQREVEKWRQIASQHGRALPELALQFVLHCPGVSVTLLGMRTFAHLEQNLRYAEAPPFNVRERDAVRAALRTRGAAG